MNQINDCTRTEDPRHLHQSVYCEAILGIEKTKEENAEKNKPALYGERAKICPRAGGGEGGRRRRRERGILSEQLREAEISDISVTPLLD